VCFRQGVWEIAKEAMTKIIEGKNGGLGSLELRRQHMSQ